MANLFFEGANLTYGFALCRRRAEVPHRTYLPLGSTRYLVAVEISMLVSAKAEKLIETDRS